jgi:sec-independent protein translocase protein TatA
MFRNPTTDLIIIVVVVLLIFGPKRLPLLGRQLGHGMREFKDGITGKSKDSDEAERPEITQTSASASPAASTPTTTSAESGSSEVVAPDRGA